MTSMTTTSHWLRTTLLLLLIGALLAPPAAGAAPQPGRTNAGGDPSKDIVEELFDLREQAVNADGLGGGDKEELARIADHAAGAHAQGQTCEAVALLDRWLRLTSAMDDPERRDSARSLYASGRGAQGTVLSALDSGERCDGHERFGAEPDVKLQRSTNARVTGRVAFGEAAVTPVTDGFRPFTRVTLPGMDARSGKPGTPAVPTWRQLIAVPRGARAVVKVGRPVVAERLDVDLVPHQHSPADNLDRKDPPFAYDERAYGSDTVHPRTPCSLKPLGGVRDLQVSLLECAGGRYQPSTQQLELYGELSFDIRFTGGSGSFVTARTLEPFESPLTTATIGQLLNRRSVLRHVDDLKLPPLICMGEEYLVLTHPTFRAAADNLAAHKRRQGMTTTVITVNDGSGPGPDTREEIDALIERRQRRCLVRPSYVLLFGDAEHIAPFVRSTMFDSTSGTDYPYALDSSQAGDLLPDLALGRIPVDTAAEAQAVVDKIVGYEGSPPRGRRFYNRAALASYFQCCRPGSSQQAGTDERAFVETTELVRNELLDRGYTAGRIYDTSLWNGSYTGSTTPRRYYNSTLLPTDLGASSGFGWNGATADISSAVNEGRFLVLHRGHGSVNGFADPGFTTADAAALTNGNRLPVVFSVNCSSGMFDNETAGGDNGTTTSGVYFAERLLRKADGGAVAVIGDTRDSPTWANNAMTEGLFDAVWPDTLPGYGTDTSQRRLGDVLNYAKTYMTTQVGVTRTTPAVGSSESETNLHLYHVLGDPTLRMWTQAPKTLGLVYDAELATQLVRVSYPHDGAVLTAYQEVAGRIQPLGRATVVNGEARLPFVTKRKAGAPVRLAVSADGHIPVLLSSRIRR